MLFRSLFAAAAFSFLFCSCVSIKPATVQLSAEVGSRISEMENVHQIAIQRYFDIEKQKVEDFMKQTWEPLFLKNFLGTSQVLDMLQKVSTINEQTRTAIQQGLVRFLDDSSEAPKVTTHLINALDASRATEPAVVRTALKKFVPDDKLDAAVTHVTSLLGTDEPARIIMDFAQAAHDEMDAQRKSLVEPIEQRKLETIAALSEAYAELIRGQATITGRLEAAARVSRQQDELLDKLGLNDVFKKVTENLAAVTQQVNDALVKANDAIKNIDKNNKVDFLNQLKDALQDIEKTNNKNDNK
jgi:hypothetical protein